MHKVAGTAISGQGIQGVTSTVQFRARGMRGVLQALAMVRGREESGGPLV